MTLDELIHYLQHRLRQSLPGHDAHLKMVSARRKIQMLANPDATAARRSGVLILLYPQDGNIMTLFIQRPEYDGVHSGQISFPGGKMEKSDTNIVETALREAEEETGLDASRVEVLGTLTELFIPPSNFIVTPVIGSTSHLPGFKPDRNEVERLIPVPLKAFKQPGAVTERQVVAAGKTYEVPCYYIQDTLIWGATAMILSEFLDLLPEGF